MQQIIYEFSSVKIYRLKGTSLALSLDAQEEKNITVIRFYEISLDGYVYTKIGIKTTPMQLYCAIKTHHRLICDMINSFISMNPEYKRLLKQ